MGYSAGDVQKLGAEVESGVGSVKPAFGEKPGRVPVPAAEVDQRGSGRDAFQQAFHAGLDTRSRGGEGRGEGLIEFPVEVYEAAGDV